MNEKCNNENMFTALMWHRRKLKSLIEIVKTFPKSMLLLNMFLKDTQKERERKTVRGRKVNPLKHDGP